MNRSSSPMDSAISVSEPLPPSVSFFFSNFHHLIPIKLNEHNYPIWKIQCEGALKASFLFDYIQQSQAPSPTITDSNGNLIPNPNYFSWFLVESHLRSCLISTLSPAILAQVTHTRTALELCELLDQKFAKPTNSDGQNSGELASGNQIRRIAPQPVSTAICQICANSGHIAAHCSYRSVKSFRPDKAHHSTALASNFASVSNATKVFDGSPNRELLAIADGSNASADTTPLPNATGTRSLLKPDFRLASPCEEMMGHQTVQRSGIPERLAFQQKSGPHVSGAKQKVISTQANQEINHSGSKQTTPTPYCATDLSSDPLKKNKMALFCTPCQVSRLWASKQDTDKNNGNGGSSKETGNAVEHTQSTNNLKIQNSEDAGLEGVPLPVYGGNTLVLMGSNGSQGTKAEGNLLQANKTSNVAHAIESKGPTDDQKIQNTPISQGTQVEGNLLQVNKTSNVGHAIESKGPTDDQKIQKTPISQGTQVEGIFSQVNETPNCGRVIESRGTTDYQKIQNTPKRKLGGESLQVNKKLNGGNAVNVSETTDSEKIRNRLQRNPEGKPMEVYRQLNSGNATIEIKRTADEQKILNTQESKLQGNSLEGKQMLNGDKAMDLTRTADYLEIQNSRKRKFEENPLQVIKKSNGAFGIELTGTADYQKSPESLEKRQERISLVVNRILYGRKAMELNGIVADQMVQNPRLEVNKLQANKKLNGGNSVGLAGTADYQKIHNSQERKLEGNSVKANQVLSGGKATTDLTVTTPDQKIHNPQEGKLEESPLESDKKLNSCSTIELVEIADHQKIQNSQERKLEGNSHEMNHSGSKQTAPIPYCATDLSSDPLKKNKMALFCTPNQVSSLWASKQETGKNNENGGSSKETGNAVEHTQSTNNLQIHNLEDARQEGMPLPVYGGNTLVPVGSNDNNLTQISQETKVEGNLLQVNKTLNGAKVVESRGTTDDQKIQNTPMRKLEWESLQVNKKLNGGNTIELTGTTDFQIIETSSQRKSEGKSMEVYTLSNGSNTVETIRINDEWKISKEGNFAVDGAQAEPDGGQGKGRVQLVSGVGGTGNVGRQAQGVLRKYQCNRCGWDHPGVDCEGKKVACNSCGKFGHRAFECRVDKNMKGKTGGRGNLRGQAQGALRKYQCKGCGNDHPGVDCEGKKVACNSCGKLGHRAFECRVDKNMKGKTVGRGNLRGPAQKALRKYQCKGCGKDHPGVDCEGKKVECFSCGKSGHRSFECRSRKQKAGNNVPTPNQIGVQFHGGGNFQGEGVQVQSSLNQAPLVPAKTGGNAERPVARPEGNVNHLGTMDERRTYIPVEDVREVAAISTAGAAGGQIPKY